MKQKFLVFPLIFLLLFINSCAIKQLLIPNKKRIHDREAYYIMLSSEIETREWQKASSTNTVESYEKYLSKYPSGQFSGNAKSFISDIKYWEIVKNKNNIQSYKSYIDSYPFGQFIKNAKNTLDPLLWEEVHLENTIEAYSEYIKYIPDGIYILEAKNLNEKLSWEKSRSQNTARAYQEYLEQFPEGRFSKMAKIAIDDINWKSAQLTNTLVGYVTYLTKYPDGQYRFEAEQDLLTLFHNQEETFWEKPKQSDTLSMYFNVLTKFSSRNATEAKQVLDKFIRTIKAASIEIAQTYDVEYLPNGGLYIYDIIENLLHDAGYKSNSKVINIKINLNQDAKGTYYRSTDYTDYHNYYYYTFASISGKIMFQVAGETINEAYFYGAIGSTEPPESILIITPDISKDPKDILKIALDKSGLIDKIKEFLDL